MMARLEAFTKPLVAAIHGDCLGGGLELALAADERVASDVARLGLPEIQLGLIPGAGGTQRLPRLIGLEASLRMILTGRLVPAVRAQKIGLVDDVVHPAVLLSVAVARACEICEERVQKKPGDGSGHRCRDLKSLLLEGNPLGRKVLFSHSEKQAREKTGGQMPAPLEAIESIRTGLEEGFEEGLRVEAEAFGRLSVSPQARALLDLLLWRRELDRESGLGTGDGHVAPRRVEKVAVLGAGLMGTGIARITAEDAGLLVRLKDLDHPQLLLGLRSLREGLKHSLKNGHFGSDQCERILARIRPTVDYTRFGRADVVIEAVDEELGIKREVLRQAETHMRDTAIFASNTSSLPVARIAEAATRPERVVGMHYFSPVTKVPLLEVVAGAETAPEVVRTCVELGKRQGKTVIVVRDGPGFYTSRILAPYLNEAVRILGEGAPVDEIDEALADFGFPVGPLKLLDEVGLDVGGKIAAVLHDAFGDRMAPSPAMNSLVEDGREGRKNGRGLYRYRRDGDGYESVGGADDTVYELLGVERREGAVPRPGIVRRCVLAMANEAVRCLDEGIVRSVRDAEVGAVFGLGFPSFRGGPLRWIDGRGARRTADDLESLAERFGSRFAPADGLLAMAGRGGTFLPSGIRFALEG